MGSAPILLVEHVSMSGSHVRLHVCLATGASECVIHVEYSSLLSLLPLVWFVKINLSLLTLQYLLSIGECSCARG